MPSDSNVYLKVRLGAQKPFADIAPQVISVDVEDLDRGTDKATVVVSDQAQVNGEVIREGMEVRIEMGWESEHALLFMGVIKRTEAVAPSAGSTTGRLRFIAYDFSDRLQVMPPNEQRQHVGTLDQILTAIAQRAQIPVADVVIDPMPQWSEDRKLEQFNRTDWQMIQDLAERYRARAFVEVNADASDSPEELAEGGASRLYFISETALLAQPKLGTLNYCRGYSSLIEFRTQRIGSGAAPSASVVTMNPETGAVVQEAGAPHAPEPPAALGANQVEGLEAAVGAGRAAGAAAAVDFANAQPVTPEAMRPVTERAGVPSDPALARGLVERDKTRIRGLFGTGLAMGTVFLRAKGSVEITGLANGASGIWYVRKVNHLYEREDTARTRNWFTGMREVVDTRLTYRTRFEATC
ncbi:hypothetical protein ACUSIJ_16270 [Pseudochelatococcus sp. B33]